jgi:uncharacterized protein YndB with AHSA1/START domain
MFKIVLLVLAVVIAGVLIAAAFRPDTLRVERSIQINAAPEKIYALIDDFHRWTVWSPWEKKDPAMKRTHSGAPSGKGAAYAWEGNGDVGSGRMVIRAAEPYSRIEIQLDFIKPFEGHNTAEFTLQPSGTGTELRWVMHGPQPYLGKVFSLFMNMDKMIGKDFEAGLAGIKASAES